jgi:hypothetical protein
VCEISCSDECNLCPILTSPILFPPESHFPGFEIPKHTKNHSEFNSRERERDGGKKEGSSLDDLMSSFNTRIAELQELVVARNSESISKEHVFLFLAKRTSSNQTRPRIRIYWLYDFQCTWPQVSLICRRWTSH